MEQLSIVWRNAIAGKDQVQLKPYVIEDMPFEFAWAVHTRLKCCALHGGLDKTCQHIILPLGSVGQSLRDGVSDKAVPGLGNGIEFLVYHVVAQHHQQRWQPVVATHRIHESTKESPDVIDTLMRGRLLQVLFEHLEPAFCDPQLQAVAILEALNQGGSAEAYFRGNVRQGERLTLRAQHDLQSRIKDGIVIDGFGSRHAITPTVGMRKLYITVASVTIEVFEKRALR
jgi:hypothetical protein